MLTYIEVVLPAFLFIANHVSGEITTGRIDCMGPAVAHKETKMKCNLTGKPPELGVVWARPDETNIVACLITTQSCDTAASVTDNYTASFDSNSTSTLTIHSFDPKTDVGVWHCKDGPNGSHTSCRKKLKEPCSIECQNGGNVDDVNCACICTEHFEGKTCEIFLNKPEKIIDYSVGIYLFVGVVLAMILLLALMVGYTIYNRRIKEKEKDQQMESLTESEGEGEPENAPTNNTSTNNPGYN